MRVTKVIGDKVLVQLEELPSKVGSILLPQGSYTGKEAVATVLKVGTGISTRKGRVPLDLKEGDRVCVVRQHEKTDTQEMIQAVLGDGMLILPSSAILYVVES